ncbi:hypothetical protein HY988_03040 [Candidatus Micrarchaeota archaeon]|nr:hypothetical protein [Candidatus Micrarchaeota archaeon]
MRFFRTASLVFTVYAAGCANTQIKALPTARTIECTAKNPKLWIAKLSEPDLLSRREAAKELRRMGTRLENKDAENVLRIIERENDLQVLVLLAHGIAEGCIQREYEIYDAAKGKYVVIIGDQELKEEDIVDPDPRVMRVGDYYIRELLVAKLIAIFEKTNELKNTYEIALVLSRIDPGKVLELIDGTTNNKKVVALKAMGKAVTWYDSNLVIALRKKFTLNNTEDGTVREAARRAIDKINSYSSSEFE